MMATSAPRTGRFRRRVLMLLVAAVAAGAGCAGSGSGRVDRPDAPELEDLRGRVATARASVESRLAAETILAGSGMSSRDVVLRLDTPTLKRIVAETVTEVLAEVRLDLRPGDRVTVGDEVEVSVGPLRVDAGSWVLAVDIERVRAVLEGGTPTLEVTGPDTFEIQLPVRVVSGSGFARLDFRWDASGLAGSVCRDFAVRETFAATIEPTDYVLEGSVRLVLEEGRIVIVPELDQRLLVQPEPTAESWRRVREILESQDRISRCGLALDVDAMQSRLRSLVREGFRFRLPADLLGRVALPASTTESVAISGTELKTELAAGGLRLTPEWLWTGLDVDLARSR